MVIQAAIITEKGGHRVLVTAAGARIEMPPIEHLLFYAGLTALVVVEIIELPVALALGIGHAILDLTHRPGMVAIGEALEAV